MFLHTSSTLKATAGSRQYHTIFSCLQSMFLFVMWSSPVSCVLCCSGAECVITCEACSAGGRKIHFSVGSQDL